MIGQPCCPTTRRTGPGAKQQTSHSGARAGGAGGVGLPEVRRPAEAAGRRSSRV